MRNILVTNFHDKGEDIMIFSGVFCIERCDYETKDIFILNNSELIPYNA